MHKNQTDKSRQHSHKGRVLARVLSEELHYVQGGGGGKPIFTHTQALPGDPGDTD